MEAQSAPIPISEARPRDPAIPPRRLLAVPGLSLDSAPSQRLLHREAAYRRALAIADLLSAALAAIVTVTFLGHDRLEPAVALLIPLIVLAGKITGLYDRDELVIRKTTIDEIPSLFQLATLCALLTWLGSSIVTTGEMDREQVLVFWLLLFAGLVVWRSAARWTIRNVVDVERCLLIGDASSYERMADKLAHPAVPATLVGRFSVADWNRHRPRTGGLDADLAALRAVLTSLEVDRVLVVPDQSDAKATLDLIRASKSMGMRVSVVPQVLEVVGSSAVYDNLDGMPVLGVPRFGLSRSSRAIKRTFDVCTAAFLLLATAPLMLVVALAVRLDSPGPVFFRQDRIGRGSRPFRMIKFRSMGVGADAAKAMLRPANETVGLFKIADDPRVTRVGRVLRKTSLDELPQLFNVLAGHMSVVGPRPLVLDEDALVQGWDRQRLDLTPGMTGPWQIMASGRVPLHEMVKIDYLYAASWSLWGDLKILLRTIVYVLGRGGL